MANNTNEKEKKMEEERVEHKNELTYADKVIEKIANYAVQEIDGILELKGDFTSGVKDFFGSKDETKGVNAEVGKKEVALDLEIIAEYGKNIPKAFDDAVELINKNINEMTNLKVVEVNMHVNDIMTYEDYQRKQNEDERKEAEKRRNERQERYETNKEGRYSDGSRVR